MRNGVTVGEAKEEIGVEAEGSSSHGSQNDWLESDEEMPGQGARNRSIRNDYEMGTRETIKVQGKLYNEGYRAGIGKGKEAMIQVGFDEGYNERGAPSGLKYGHLQGTVAGLEQLASRPNEEFQKQLDALKRTVQSIRLSHVVEPDWEALEHEREHGAQEEVVKETEEERSAREQRLDELQGIADSLQRSLISETRK